MSKSQSISCLFRCEKRRDRFSGDLARISAPFLMNLTSVRYTGTRSGPDQG